MLVWLPLKDRLLAVITFNCFEVLILLLGIRAITYEMPVLSTIVAKAGWKFFGLGNLLLIFLDDTEILHLSPSCISACELVSPSGSWVVLPVSQLRLLTHGRVSL
jgi:hypothetical protein